MLNIALRSYAIATPDLRSRYMNTPLSYEGANCETLFLNICPTPSVAYELTNRLFSLSLYISLSILAIVMVVSPRLTKAQLALLEMFSFEMSEAEVLAMRQTLMQHFRTRLEEEVQKAIQQKGLTTAQLEEQMNFENRTQRLDQIRAVQ